MKKSEAVKRIQELETTLESCLNELRDLRLRLEGRKKYPVPTGDEIPRVLLLAKVDEAGGVDKETLYKFWQELGKDTRGLGGFFKGKKPLLVKDSKGRILVSESGGELLQRYRKFLEDKGFNLKFANN